MSPYKTFAIAGAGNVGLCLLEALIKLKGEGKVDSVVVLTRSEGGNPKANELGAKSITVDYSDKASLVAALKGIDVLVSTVGFPGLGGQTKFALAAKEAGVKLFVPAEYGAPAIDMGGMKVALRTKCKEIGLPYTLFFVGIFLDIFFGTFMGIDLEKGTAHIGGTGDEPLTFTAIADIGPYIAHVLTTLPADKLEYATILIEGDRGNLNEIFAEYEKGTGKTIKITHRPDEEMKASLAGNPGDFASLYYLKAEEGHGVIGAPDEVNLYAPTGWKPKKIKEFLLEGAKA